MLKENNYNFPEMKVLALDDFTDEFCQIFKEEIIPNLYNLFQKIRDCETIIIVIPNPEKDMARKENYRSVSHMNIL